MRHEPRSDAPPRVLLPTVATLVFSVVIVGLVAWVCGQGGITRWGVPAIAFGAMLALAINWIAFLPAFATRTERYYDLTGSLTYLAATATGLLAAGVIDARAVVIAVLIAIWSIRLGLFLFRRIRADGRDARFDGIKQSGPRFLVAWTLQGVWVFLTLAAALTAITNLTRAPLGIWFGIGLAVWLAGFTIEVVADHQKRVFRRANDRKTEFITTGLWAWSRHPNYFGEIVLWIGIAVMAAPTFRGWQWVALVSPVFVYLLLSRGSGVPILEKRADEKWGGQPSYEEYKAGTPVLIPRPPAR